MKELRGLPGLCLLLLLLYLPTLGQGFHFDDYHMVVENQFITDWRHLPQMVTAPSISSVPVAKGMVRPVLMASYTWNYWTGRTNPVGYHLVNIGLHALATCLPFLSVSPGIDSMTNCPGRKEKPLLSGRLSLKNLRFSS